MANFDFKNFQVGKNIDGWKITEKVAESDFSQIYKIEKPDQKAIIKFPKNLDNWNKIENEKTILTLLQKYPDFFPRLLDFGHAVDNEPWIIIEFIELDNLQALIKDSGPLNELEWFYFAKLLMQALTILENLDISHEDIKPSNIFYRDSKIKIIDFGLATLKSNNNLNNNENDELSDPLSENYAGTFEYSSPEHFSFEHVPAMDVFSAASTLVFAAKGKSPFQGTSPFEWFTAIEKLSPDLKKLTLLQQKFVNPLFPKNKSQRRRASDGLKIVDQFINNVKENQLGSRQIRINRFSKAGKPSIDWPQFERLDNLEISVPNVDANLFSKNQDTLPKRIRKIVRNFKYKIHFIVLVLLTLFVYLLYTSISATKNAELNTKYSAQILSCLEHNATKALNIKSSLKECRELLPLNLPIINKSFANLYAKAQSYDQQEKLLLVNAKFDLGNYGDDLIEFYGKDNNFETYAKKWIVDCLKSQDLFCVKVNAMYLASKGDYSIARTNLFIGIKQKDYESIYLLNRLNVRNSKPLELTDELYSGASNNWRAQQFLYSYFSDKGDLPKAKYWLELGTRNGNPLIITLDSLKKSLELSANNKLTLEEAEKLAKTCLNQNYKYIDLYAGCFAIYSGLYSTLSKDEKFSDNEKMNYTELVDSYYLKMALLENTYAERIVGSKSILKYYDAALKNEELSDTVYLGKYFLEQAAQDQDIDSMYWLSIYYLLADKVKYKEQACTYYQNAIDATKDQNSYSKSVEDIVDSENSIEDLSSLKNTVENIMGDLQVNCSIIS
jgi:serine/threonine protein kinase